MTSANDEPASSGKTRNGMLTPQVQRDSAPFRVMTYSRVSSLTQARHGQSIVSQPESLGKYAEARGWQVIGELSDGGLTGRNADRAGFKAVMDALAERRPDAVLVTRLSRFMRNARLTLNAVHEMRELGVALICTDEPIDTRQRGVADMFLAILATMAEWESDRLSEYAKEGRQRLIAKGRLPSGRPPYGYNNDKAVGRLIVASDKAEVVRLVYSLYVDKRLGMQNIARELTGRAIPTPSGNKIWTSNSVMRMLSDSAYVGRHALGIPTPAIVNEDDYARAQTIRKSNQHLHPPRKDPWALQGRFKCSVCGSTLQCEYARGHRYYRCPGRTKRSKYFLQTGKRCGLAGLRAEEVEFKLLAAIRDAMLRPDNFARALERSIDELRNRIKDLEREAAPLEKGLADAENELTRIERAWIRGRLSEEELRKLERDAQARSDRIRSQLDALDTGDLQDLEKTRDLIRSAEKSLDLARSAKDNWWSHPEAPPVWFTDVLTPPDWPNGELANDPSPQSLAYDTFPPIDPSHISKTLNEALNRLHAQVYAKPDELEVRGG